MPVTAAKLLNLFELSKETIIFTMIIYVFSINSVPLHRTFRYQAANKVTNYILGNYD